MTRSRTERERAVLGALIERATCSEGPVHDDQRARWLAQVPETLAGRRCGCGSCPSIELVDADGARPAFRNRIVLDASCDDGILLLFVDDDRISDLELAPIGDRSFAEFPEVDALEF